MVANSYLLSAYYGLGINSPPEIKTAAAIYTEPTPCQALYQLTVTVPRNEDLLRARPCARGLTE